MVGVVRVVTWSGWSEWSGWSSGRGSRGLAKLHCGASPPSVMVSFFTVVFVCLLPELRALYKLP